MNKWTYKDVVGYWHLSRIAGEYTGYLMSHEDGSYSYTFYADSEKELKVDFEREVNNYLQDVAEGIVREVTPNEQR